MTVKGYGAAELDQHLSRAMALGDEAEDAGAMAPLIYGRWSLQQVTGLVTQSRAFAEQFVDMAERQAEPEARMVAYRVHGTSLQVCGMPAAAQAALQRTLTLFDPARDTALAYVYGGDIKVAALCSRALARWSLGRHRSAEADINEAWERARALGHGNTLTYCASYRLALWAMCGRTEGFGDMLACHGRLVAEERPPVWVATMPSYAGWLRLRTGDLEGAAAALRDALAAMQAINLVYWRPTVEMWMGETLGALRRHDEAEAMFVSAHGTMARTGERWAEAELFRLWACMRADAGRDGAAALFQSALGVAEEQGAAALALRTWLELARRPALCTRAAEGLAAALAAMPEDWGGTWRRPGAGYCLTYVTNSARLRPS